MFKTAFLQKMSIISKPYKTRELLGLFAEVREKSVLGF